MVIFLGIKASCRAAILFALAVTWHFATLAMASTTSGGEADIQRGSTADHRLFDLLDGPFETGPQVTEACLSCHTEAAAQVQGSTHWTWSHQQAETGQTLGKRHVINNLTMGIAGNYERCTSCHVGYGWSDSDFNFQAEEQVDCLVCHDTTGEYVKLPAGAGHPAVEDRKIGGELIEAPDLSRVARHVGPTSRATCGGCHFESGGGDAVKHGVLDSSLLDGPRSVDVHMSPEGGDFSCSVCHEFSGHVQPGSRYHIDMPDYENSLVPAHPHDKPACAACHGSEPHKPGLYDKLNSHGDFIACQTCHVPEIARGGLSTKTVWDWSEAGRMDDGGGRIVEHNAQGRVIYDTKTGAFEWREDYPPTYRWFDGNMMYTLLDHHIDASDVVSINWPMGGVQQENSKIWPFKVLRGRQPYDAGNERLITAKLFGREGEESAYWRGYDWDKSIRAGMQAAQALGQTDAGYSGDYGFVDTRMYWPVTHMVAPAEESLRCGECHRVNGRMTEVAGINYIPGQDRIPLIERIGWGAVWISMLAVLAHGSLRFYWHRRRQQSGNNQDKTEH